MCLKCWTAKNVKLCLDTKLNEATQTQEIGDRLEKAKKDVEILSEISERLKEVSRETEEIQDKIFELKDKAEKDYRNFSAIHASQLELLVNTENGQVKVAIEFPKVGIN